MISIVIPWIRKAKFKRCVKMIKRNAGAEFEIVSKEDRKRIGCPKMVKKLVERAKGEYVCFLGDDTLPHPDFLKHALEDMANLPDGWGLVGLNEGPVIIDGVKRKRILPAHWLASKKLLPLLGGEFFNTSYNHCCCDVELMERCMAMGRYIYSEKAIVKHDHALLMGKQMTDPDLLRVYSPEIRGADQQLLKLRRENKWK